MSALPLVQLEGTDGEDLAAAFDMTYAGDVNDFLEADWRLTLRNVADPADVLIDLKSGDPLRNIRVSAPDDAPARITFEVSAMGYLVAGRGGVGDPIVFAGELLFESPALREAMLRVELALMRANTTPGTWQ